MSAPTGAHGPEQQTRYADDLEVGAEYPLGSYEVTQADIIDFATAWDPQYFHVDPVLAGQSPLRGLAASGIHTMAIFQRLSVLGEYVTWKMVAGKALRDLRFVTPVRPGDVLTGRFVVTDRVPDGRGRATVTLACDLRNQIGAVVMKMTLDCVVLMRPDSSPG